MSPGPVSDSFRGPEGISPYVPHWCYPRGPKMCRCNHHEGFHNDAGVCLRQSLCGCQGLPDSCRTALEDML